MSIQAIAAYSRLEVIDAKALNKDSSIEDIIDVIIKIADRAFPEKESNIPPEIYTRHYLEPSIRCKTMTPRAILLSSENETLNGFMILINSFKNWKIPYLKNISSPQKTEQMISEKCYLHIPLHEIFDIPWIAVDPKSHRSGIGTQLMHAAMKKTKEWGGRYLSLTYACYNPEKSEVENTKINAFYDSFRLKDSIPIIPLKMHQERYSKIYWLTIAYDLVSSKDAEVYLNILTNKDKELTLFEAALKRFAKSHLQLDHKGDPILGDLEKSSLIFKTEED